MNLREIREECWDLARETGTNDLERLWSTTEMNRYINRVYRYIARETKCIRDSYTESVCRIVCVPPADLSDLETLALTNPFAADDLREYNTEGGWLYHTLVAPRTHALHPSIIDIDEIKWLNWPWRLTKVSVSKWQQNPYWERVMGSPTEFCTDYTNQAIALNYRMSTSDTMLLIVRRLPLTKLAKDIDVPEFRESYHDYFINGVMWQMYSKQDTQTFDQKKADAYELSFYKDVDEIKQQETILNQMLHVNHAMRAFL